MNIAATKEIRNLLLKERARYCGTNADARKRRPEGPVPMYIGIAPSGLYFFEAGFRGFAALTPGQKLSALRA